MKIIEHQQSHIKLLINNSCNIFYSSTTLIFFIKKNIFFILIITIQLNMCYIILQRFEITQKVFRII